MYALEKEMATRSSIIAWRIPGMEGPDGLLPCGVVESDTTEVTQQQQQQQYLSYNGYQAQRSEWKNNFFMRNVFLDF